MSYTTEQGVYDTTGFNSDILQELSNLPAAEVATLIASYITNATKKIRDDIGYPLVITKERHLGDGYSWSFELGPQDDPYATLGGYDPTNGLVEIYDAWFAGAKIRRPWPIDCEYGTEAIASWGSSNCTLSAEATLNVHDDTAIKMLFSAAGYAYYPSGKNAMKNIYPWGDVFFSLRTTNKNIVITLRLYDKDGNYEEQTITPTINDTDEFYFIDIATMTDSITWNNTLFQYFEIRVAGATTLYLDNFCFSNGWTFTKPLGLLHVSKPHNISGEAAPSENYPFYVTYGYDPFLASTPANITEAAEWLCGISIIDYLRGIRDREVSYRLFGDSMEPDADSPKGLLGVRSKMMQNYERCMQRWGGGSYGTV